MTTGFEGIAAGASALAGQAAGLRAAVDSGKIVMTPEAAEAVAKVYQKKRARLAQTIARTDQLIVTGAYGDCYIGRQLEDKFRQKVEAQTGLVAILRQMQETLKNMEQAFRDSARDMTNIDDEHAQNLNRNV